jgi:Salt tolerance down-regulator
MPGVSLSLAGSVAITVSVLAVSPPVRPRFRRAGRQCAACARPSTQPAIPVLISAHVGVAFAVLRTVLWHISPVQTPITSACSISPALHQTLVSVAVSPPVWASRPSRCSLLDWPRLAHLHRPSPAQADFNAASAAAAAMANGKPTVKIAAPPAAAAAAALPAVVSAADAAQPAAAKKKKQKAAAKTVATPAALARPQAGLLPPSPDLDEEDPDETDSEDGMSPTAASAANINGHGDAIGAKKKNKKKKKNKANGPPADDWAGYDGRPQMPHMDHSHPSYSLHHTSGRDRIWNTSSHEERERIKDFWRSLGESDRKSLLKVEKDTVIKTMKEQQKHSCSCTVCGRKRHAIEEELEVLYDAYYSEIEQYALEQAKNGNTELPYSMDMARNRALGRTSSRDMPPPPIQPLSDDEYDDEEYDDEEEDIDSADYSLEDDERRHPVAADLRIFGNSLEIEGNQTALLGLDAKFAREHAHCCRRSAKKRWQEVY